MKDFLFSLYSNENFPIYLGLFIVVLVIAFVVVYYWGRKDQKLIETRKLEKINIDNNVKEKDAFKETSEEKKIEVKPKTYEEEKIELPKKVEMSIPSDVPEFEMPKRKIDTSFEYTRTLELPKLNEASGTKTVNIEDFDLLAASIDEELTSLENYHNSFNQAQEDVDYLYEETEEIELPKLRR